MLQNIPPVNVRNSYVSFSKYAMSEIYRVFNLKVDRILI